MTRLIPLLRYRTVDSSCPVSVLWLQVAKAVSQALNNCVNCLPGLREVDVAVKYITTVNTKLSQPQVKTWHLRCSVRPQFHVTRHSHDKTCPFVRVVSSQVEFGLEHC